MVSVQSWTLFKFYGDYWLAHPDQFPDENALHPTVKDGNPMTVEDIRARDQKHMQDLRDKGNYVEIMWEKDWQVLLTQRPEIKTYLAQHHTFTHFKSICPKIKLFNILKMVICLVLLNVILMSWITLKNIFQK